MFVLPATITHASAMQVREDAKKFLADGSQKKIIRGDQLATFDSTALAVLVALARTYPEVQMVNMPAKLISLSKVYGIDKMLPMV